MSAAVEPLPVPEPDPSATVTEKRCTRCGEVKPLGAFGKHPNRRDGRKSWCQECYRAYVSEQRANPRSDLSRYTRAQSRAQNKALSTLRDRHRPEYEALLDEAMRAEGLR